MLLVWYDCCMRVRLSKKSLEILFNTVEAKYKRWVTIANKNKVSVRTLSDWRKGEISMPLLVFRKILADCDLKEEKVSFTILSDFWHTKDAGRKGAAAAMKLYGNFGAPEGRKLGGQRSIATHKKRQTAFKTLKPIAKPKHSKKLAELLGIFVGDGHLSDYQASVCTNSKTDKEHAMLTSKLIKSLFRVPVSLRELKNENTIIVVASSVSVVKFLNKQGMPQGNKLKNNLTVPGWIIKKRTYQKAFLRGLFDTDGCIYLDKHKINKKRYNHLGWAVTSYAEKLRKDVMEILANLGYSPTNRDTQKSVYLRKQKEIAKYFREIGTNNSKHLTRYRKFIKLTQ